MSNRKLDDFQAPVKLKLALLWASLMFLYIYNDYFNMYAPGMLEQMAAGRLGPLGEATQPKMIGVSLMLAIPAMMIFCSVGFPPTLSRWLNVLFGIVYTAIDVLTLLGSELWFQIIVGLETALTVLIVWYALRWPKAAA